MSSIRCHISMSLDGYVAGPNQSLEEPLGEGGERLHEWAFRLESWRRPHGREGGESGPDGEVLEEVQASVGAHVMGRKMFGGGDGAWNEEWRGWWGEEPPFHTPVFVLTHHPREPLRMEGGTKFEFVTEGIDAAVERAREAAGGKDVMVAGGASVVQQALAAGLLDELYLHIVPVLLGGGVRLLENAGEPTLEPVEAVTSPRVTHVKYRVVR